MSTTTVNKTAGTSLFALQTIATAAAGAGKLSSGAIDVSTKLGTIIVVNIGRTAVTAFTATNGSVDVFFQGLFAASGNRYWRTLWVFSTGAAAACSTNALAASGNSASGNIGDTNAVTLTGNAAIDYSNIGAVGNCLPVYIRNATVANGEFARCRFASTSSASLYLFDDITNDQNSSNLYGGAQGSDGAWSVVYNPPIGDGLKSIRVVVHNKSGQSVDVEAYMVTGDSMSTS